MGWAVALQWDFHALWGDDISLLDARYFHHPHMHSHNQLTDLYLLALAVKNGGRLISLDQRIPLSAVQGARGAFGQTAVVTLWACVQLFLRGGRHRSLKRASNAHFESSRRVVINISSCKARRQHWRYRGSRICSGLRFHRRLAVRH